MASDASNFRKIINDTATYFEWEVEWNEGMASIDFESEAGNTLTVYITQNEGMVEFDIPSEAAFDSEDEIPAEMSTILLKRNRLLTVGAWAIEEWDEQWYYSLIFNSSLEELEPMAYETIQSRIEALVEEVDEFNKIWSES